MEIYIILVMVNTLLGTEACLGGFTRHSATLQILDGKLSIKNFGLRHSPQQKSAHYVRERYERGRTSRNFPANYCTGIKDEAKPTH